MPTPKLGMHPSAPEKKFDRSQIEASMIVSRSKSPQNFVDSDLELARDTEEAAELSTID
jgi:hypothetical protein